jgi:hypothetical protein
MKNFKTCLAIACLVNLSILINSNLYSQEYRLGGAAIYNFSSKGIGIDARAEFPLKRVKLLEGLSIVPQFSYFPPFNEVTEFYLGSSIHLGFYKINKWIFYGLVNASYNGWLNYDESTDANAEFSNLAFEGGLGITRKKCVRPFLEFRLNAVGIEPSIRLGLLYTFNCERRGAVPCSKIPPQPQF